jgi:hypothetical protein
MTHFVFGSRGVWWNMHDACLGEGGGVHLSFWILGYRMHVSSNDESDCCRRVWDAAEMFIMESVKSEEGLEARGVCSRGQ